MYLRTVHNSEVMVWRTEHRETFPAHFYTPPVYFYGRCALWPDCVISLKTNDTSAFPTTSLGVPFVCQLARGEVRSIEDIAI